tara:strand:+ start:571 stop:870 length:300 start_codon:yes stop_codon:yes gene_type:complete
VEFGRHIGLKIRGFFKREGSSPSDPKISCSINNKEKENDMSTVKEVNKEVKNLKQTISGLNSRISSLVDEMHILKGEVKRFKSDVAKDITTLEKMHKEG